MLKYVEGFSIETVGHLFGGNHTRVYLNKKRTKWKDFTDWQQPIQKRKPKAAIRAEEQKRRLAALGADLEFPRREEIVPQIEEDPPRHLVIDRSTYWYFRGRFYKDTDNMTAEEVAAVIIAREMRKEQVVKRAKSIAATPIQQTPDRRRIPDDVKLLVWVRDKGQCVKCGSTTELQYDHDIPVSLGGGSSPENVQLLCGPCNRRKGNSIT